MGQPKLRSALTKSLGILGGVAVGAVLRHIMQHDACSNTGTIGKQRSRIFAEGDRILAWRWCFFRVSKLVEKGLPYHPLIEAPREVSVKEEAAAGCGHGGRVAMPFWLVICGGVT